MKQTFIVACRVHVEAGAQPLTSEEVLAEVKEAHEKCGLHIDSHLVSELRKDVVWNRNIDVYFQLWLEEQCKGLWP